MKFRGINFEVKKTGDKTVRIFDNQRNIMGEMTLKLDKGDHTLVIVLDNDDNYAN